MVTEDEVWVHYYYLESTYQIKEWRNPDENSAHTPHSKSSAGKIMASVFWDCDGILLLNLI